MSVRACTFDSHRRAHSTFAAKRPSADFSASTSTFAHAVVTFASTSSFDSAAAGTAGSSTTARRCGSSASTAASASGVGTYTTIASSRSGNGAARPTRTRTLIELGDAHHAVGLAQVARQPHLVVEGEVVPVGQKDLLAQPNRDVDAAVLRTEHDRGEDVARAARQLQPVEQRAAEGELLARLAEIVEQRRLTHRAKRGDRDERILLGAVLAQLVVEELLERLLRRALDLEAHRRRHEALRQAARDGGERLGEGRGVVLAVRQALLDRGDLALEVGVAERRAAERGEERRQRREDLGRHLAVRDDAADDDVVVEQADGDQAEQRVLRRRAVIEAPLVVLDAEAGNEVHVERARHRAQRRADLPEDLHLRKDADHGLAVAQVRVAVDAEHLGALAAEHADEVDDLHLAALLAVAAVLEQFEDLRVGRACTDESDEVRGWAAGRRGGRAVCARRARCSPGKGGGELLVGATHRLDEADAMLAHVRDEGAR